jgi:acyl carrier protein
MKDIKRFFDKQPDLWKVKPHHLTKIVNDKLGINLDFNKTWLENGLDDLDMVELIMQLEKDLDINIPDELAEIIFNDKPSIIYDVVAENRVDKINKLGIE